MLSLGAIAANDAFARRFLAHPRVLVRRNIMISFVAASGDWLKSESAHFSAAEIGAIGGCWM